LQSFSSCSVKQPESFKRFWSQGIWIKNFLTRKFFIQIALAVLYAKISGAKFAVTGQEKRQFVREPSKFDFW
jgi:hypothetical protein